MSELADKINNISKELVGNGKHIIALQERLAGVQDKIANYKNDFITKNEADRRFNEIEKDVDRIVDEFEKFQSKVVTKESVATLKFILIGIGGALIPIAINAVL